MESITRLSQRIASTTTIKFDLENQLYSKQNFTETTYSDGLSSLSHTIIVQRKPWESIRIGDRDLFYFSARSESFAYTFIGGFKSEETRFGKDLIILAEIIRDAKSLGEIRYELRGRGLIEDGTILGFFNNGRLVHALPGLEGPIALTQKEIKGLIRLGILPDPI